MGSLTDILSEAKQARNTSLPAKDIVAKIYKGYMEEDSWKQKKSFAPSGLFYGSGACSRRWVLSFKGNYYESKATPLEFARMKRGTASHGDIEEAMNAAASVGDDVIQKKYQGRVYPDSFTHGSAAQRKEWFRKGYQTGDFDQGDTFRANI